MVTQKQNGEKGFITLLMIVVISIIVMLWLSTQYQSITSIYKTKQIKTDFYELEQVKRRLLAYATLHPEYYQIGSGVPAPGFFPCPDLPVAGVVDGSPESFCTNPFMPGQAVLPYEAHTGFVPDFGNIGYVPESITSKHVYFAEKGRYFYFLDERFSYNNGSYSDSNNRFAPMNLLQFEGEVHSGLADSKDKFEPVLTLNGKKGYIALIIDAGDDGLDDENNVDGDGHIDRHFVSYATDLSDDPNEDKIVGITFEEWSNAVNRRACLERFRYGAIAYEDTTVVNPFTAVPEDKRHWYNNFDSTNNPEGTNLRSINLECSYAY